MMQRLVLREPAGLAYVRNALFALELLDPVTLSRVSDGIVVVADGLRGEAAINAGGLFVWRQEDLSTLRRISIDPGVRPYQSRDLDPTQLRLPPLPIPLTTIELSPRIDYDFPVGITGMRATLIESRVVPPVPVTDADVHLRWLDDDGVTWHDSPTTTRTNAKGDAAAIVRFAPADAPQVDSAGAITVRMRARRGATERTSADVQLPLGRVADATTSTAMTFAWDELLP